MHKPTSDCRATERKHPWPMVRLGDVCTIEFGTRVRRKDSQGGDYPVYGGGGATFCWSTYNREDQCIVSRFAMSEECVRFVKGKFFLNDSGLSVRSDNQDLSQTYLDWVLYSKQPEIYALGRGAAQKNLDVEQFVDMMLPLPPLSVQREIVARLERELAAVKKMKKGFEALAETAKAEFKAELKEVFEEISRRGAEMRRLGDVCELILGFAFKSIEFGDFSNKVIRIGNINPPSIDFSDGIGVNTQAYPQKKLSKYVAYEGDCLVAMTGATIGKMGVMGVGRAYVNQRVLIVRAKSWLDQKYLSALLMSAPFRKFTEINADSKAAQPNISAGTIGSYEIPLPTLSAQREVVARLDAAKARAEKLEAKAREGVAVCETMRKAILKEAFE